MQRSTYPPVCSFLYGSIYLLTRLKHVYVNDKNETRERL